MNHDKPLPTVNVSRTHSRELWVGVFVIIGVVAGLTALFSLTDAAMFRGRYIVYTVVPDAGGIRRGDPVRMRGVNIGRVTRFEIAERGVLVSLEIESRYPIPADSRIVLRSSGLIGGMVANVVPGTNALEASWHDTLTGTSPRGMMDQAGELQSKATQAMEQVRRLLDSDTIRNVHQASDDLRQLLHDLARTAATQQGELQALSQSLRRSAQAVESAVTAPSTEASLQRLSSLATRLDDIATSLGRSAVSAEGILGRIERGEGTLGRLAQDEDLYDHASAAAASVQKAADEFARVATDIRENPKRYVQVSVF